MTLPAAGTITSAAIRAEMDGFVGNLVFPSAATLWLAGKAAAPIVFPNDFHSKSWGPTLTGHLRFGADSSPGSTWTIPSGAPWNVGNLVIVNQFAENSAAGIPASVIPAGWTQIGASVTMTTADGNGARMNTSYRIITAGQLGSTVTGMLGAGRNRVCGCIYDFNRALLGVGIVEAGQALAQVAPGNLTMDWDAVRDGSHLYVGMAHAELSIPTANYTWTTAPDDQGAPSTTRTYFKSYENVVPASSIIMALDDLGTFNAHSAALLRLT